jgi:hypothetical protein
MVKKYSRVCYSYMLILSSFYLILEHHKIL